MIKPIAFFAFAVLAEEVPTPLFPVKVDHERPTTEAGANQSLSTFLPPTRTLTYSVSAGGQFALPRSLATSGSFRDAYRPRGHHDRSWLSQGVRWVTWVRACRRRHGTSLLAGLCLGLHRVPRRLAAHYRTLHSPRCLRHLPQSLRRHLESASPQRTSGV